VADLASVPDHLRARFETGASVRELLEMMDDARVDAALLVSSWVYGSDHSYALEAASASPARFGVVGPVDPTLPDVGERVRTFREHAGALGIRVVERRGVTVPLGDSGWDEVFRPAEEAGVPVFLLGPQVISSVPGIARAHPELQLVLDHLGGIASSSVGPSASGIARLPELLSLAQYDNVALKCTNVPTLSRAGYPFADLWPLLHAVLSAFGPERTMWGSDITMHRGDLSYSEAVGYIRETTELSESEKTLVLGASLRRILDWPSA
jgi:predicted TIM-barrel fold metal-dependent hydrolase